MNAVLPKIRLNGFDFDSTEPIPAHELKESKLMPWLIENLVAWDIVLVGAWACKWMYYGGYNHLISCFIRFAPNLYNMATTGQM